MRVKCPSCGAIIETNANGFGKCEYCETEVNVVDGKIVSPGDGIDFKNVSEKNSKKTLGILVGSAAIIALLAYAIFSVNSSPVNKIKKTLKNSSIGSIVEFGKYEQDNNTSNGTEKIEWIVIDKNDSSCLLISKYLLNNMIFDGGSNTNWENSIVRKWLNGGFYNDCFSDAEKSLVKKKTVNADENELYPDVYQGANTNDYVFLLSTSEAVHYLNDSNIIAIPTEYAKKQGSYGAYWLRTMGNDNNSVTRVRSSEGVSDLKSAIKYDGGSATEAMSVRPCVWVNYK